MSRRADDKAVVFVVVLAVAVAIAWFFVSMRGRDRDDGTPQETPQSEREIPKPDAPDLPSNDRFRTS